MTSRLTALFKKYHKEAENASWLLIEKVVNLLLNFVFFMILARYLGPALLGQYSIILSLFFTLVPIANLGLNGLAAKEFIDSHHSRQMIFGTTVGIRLVGSLIAAMIALAIACAGWFSIAPTQILIVGLLALSNMSRSLGIIELFYKSQSQNKYPVMVRMLVLTLSTSIKLLGIYLDRSLNYFLLLIGVEWILTHLGYYILLSFTDKSLLHWNFSRSYGISLLTRSLWLVLSGLASYVYLKTDILMIGYFIGNEQAGYYSAATRLSEIWYFVPTMVLAVFYPKLQQLKQSEKVEYQHLLSLILKALMAISFVIALATTLFSDFIITWLYGENFHVTSSLVAIQVWVLNFVFIRGVYSSWLLLEECYKYSLISHLAGAVVNILLNLLLIPLYAGQGAAMATLSAYLVSSVVVVVVFQKTRSFAILTGQVALQLLMLPFMSFKGRRI